MDLSHTESKCHSWIGGGGEDRVLGGRAEAGEGSGAEGRVAERKPQRNSRGRGLAED